MCSNIYLSHDLYWLCSKIEMVKELLEGIHLVASLEAISLGTKAGIHPWIIYDIISNAAGNSWCVFMHIKLYIYILLMTNFHALKSKFETQVIIYLLAKMLYINVAD